MSERVELGELLYANPLASERDIENFRLEGSAAITFPLGRMRMENLMDEEEGQKANFVFWCPENFPDHIAVSWEFKPIREPGLCILFFAARGRGGEDLFDPQLNLRSGPYGQYHHGDIDAYHVSYFRRKNPDERRLHTCNLRKSYGFHLVEQGADPIPSIQDVKDPYRIQLIKFGAYIEFSINGLVSFRWQDEGTIGGPPHCAGKIGFRQMAPLIAEYANLTVHRVNRYNGLTL
jgi:hypothetical protein